MSSFTEGQIHQLADALQNVGLFTPDDVTKLGQFPDLKRIRGVVRGELMISELTRCWREHDGVIYFSVVSDGMTGPGWVKWLDENGYKLSAKARSLLTPSSFKPTNGLVYTVAVIKGTVFEDGRRFSSNINDMAMRSRFTKPNAEIACLIRKKLSNKELEAMRLSQIVAMHEPIDDPFGNPRLLCVCCSENIPCLATQLFNPGEELCNRDGFAFVASQTPQS